MDAWPWTPIGGGDWAKSGACPRCDHHITVTDETSLVAHVEITEEALMAIMVQAEEGPLAAEGSDGREQFFARCDCSAEHPARPGELTRGCGAWACIDPPPADE